jgi:transcriptional regulator with XRE-family HTH domain
MTSEVKAGPPGLGYPSCMAHTAARSALGTLLRGWRTARRLTQEDLADAAEVSVRHLSFLETGRSRASREMILVLASALDLPLRERNTLLGAAGFAPAYLETPLDDAPMVHVRRALDHLLAQQEPFPAIVVDRLWNVKRMNAGAERLFGRFYLPRNPPEIAVRNLAHALFHPEGLRHVIVAWPAVAAEFAERLHREAAADLGDHGPRALRDAVLAYSGLPDHIGRPRVAEAPAVALALHLRAPDGVEGRFFTTLTTLGTPLDVTAAELRVESYFPLDDETDALMRELTGQTTARQ